MADEPQDLTIRILQQMQETLADQSRRLEAMQAQMDRRFERLQAQVDHRFDGVERKLGEVIDSTTKALGQSAMANVRHDSVQQHFAEVELEQRELRARPQRLEEKV
jgi:hypothetical protein